MKTLSKLQLDHAHSRIEAAAKKQIEALGAAPKVVAYDFDAKYKLIAAGKAKLKPRADVSQYTDLHDAYTYPEHPDTVKIKAAKKTYDAKVRAIKDRAAKLYDKLVFVGSDEAMSLLEAFLNES